MWLYQCFLPIVSDFSCDFLHESWGFVCILGKTCTRKISMWCKFIERCHDTKRKKNSSRLSPSSLDIVSGCVNHVIWLQTLQFLHLPCWKLIRTIKFIYSEKASKGLVQLDPRLYSGWWYLPSQWDRQLKFSAYASFLISWSLSKFEII